MIVASRPLFTLRSLFRTRQVADNDGLPLPIGKLYFFQHGRDALVYALSELCVKPDAKVLFPAYFCETTLSPLREQGYGLIFFDVEDRLQGDCGGTSLEKITTAATANNVAAMVIPDWFGLQDKSLLALAQWCQKNAVVLIMDYCHCFFSFQSMPLAQQSQVDAVFFSVRKNLPVSDGGALYLNKELALGSRPMIKPAYRDLSFLVVKLIEWLVIAFGWPNIYGGGVGKLRNYKRVDAQQVGQLFPDKPGFFLYQQLSDARSMQEIADKRVENYQKLYRGLMQLDPGLAMFSLVDGFVPQTLPVFEQTGELYLRLRISGIGAYLWPADELPPEIKSNPRDFPNAVKLSHAVVCLPIHQSIGDRQIAYMVKVITAWHCKSRNGNEHVNNERN